MQTAIITASNFLFIISFPPFVLIYAQCCVYQHFQDLFLFIMHNKFYQYTINFDRI